MEAEKKQQHYEQEEVDKCLIPGLPDEIAMECLIRVPHEFHSSMKSVCLKWQNLISDPSFYQQRVKSNTAEHLVFQVQPLPKQSAAHMMVHDHALITSTKKEEDDSHSPPQYALTIYNATYETWQRMIPSFGIPMFCQCVALQSCGKLLLLGGWNPKTLEPVSDVYVLDMIKGSSIWRKGASMSVARSFFACAVVGGSKVYVAGGHDNQKNALKSAEVYDVDKDEWVVLPEMEEERDECLGMCWDGDDRFWVVSGYGTETQGRFRCDGEYFDPATGFWFKIDNLWPFQSLSPKCCSTSTTVTLKSNNSGGKQCEWLWFLGNEQQQQQQFEYEEKERRWKLVSSIVQLPKSVIGTSSASSSSCVSVTTLGDHQFNQQRVFVMSGNVGRGSSSSSLKCNECEGEGAFMVERDTSNGNAKWSHVHTPVGFSGFPYSASYLLI